MFATLDDDHRVGAPRHGLPTAWLEELDAWRRAAASAAGPVLDEGGPATLRELLAVPGVEERSTLRSKVGFLAIHGGDLEAMTDVVAERAADAAGASFYAVRHPLGYRGHLASVAFDPADSARLAAFVEHVDVAISIHGYGRAGRWVDVLVGGGNRAVAAHIAAVVGAGLDGYSIVTDLDAIPVELRGLHHRNPANRPRRGGVQIELPPRVRGLSPLSPPTGPDGLSPPTRAHRRPGPRRPHPATRVLNRARVQGAALSALRHSGGSAGDRRVTSGRRAPGRRARRCRPRRRDR